MWYRRYYVTCNMNDHQIWVAQKRKCSCCVWNTEQEGRVQHSGLGWGWGIYGGSSSTYIYRLVKVWGHFLEGGVSRIGSFYLTCSVRRGAPRVWKVKRQSYPSQGLYALSLSFRPQPSYQWGKNTWYPLDGRKGEPQSRPGRGREDKNGRVCFSRYVSS